MLKKLCINNIKYFTVTNHKFIEFYNNFLKSYIDNNLLLNDIIKLFYTVNAVTKIKCCIVCLIMNMVERI